MLSVGLSGLHWTEGWGEDMVGLEIPHRLDRVENKVKSAG